MISAQTMEKIQTRFNLSQSNVETFDLHSSKASNISENGKCIVHCKNLDGLIQFVKEKRQVSQAEENF